MGMPTGRGILIRVPDAPSRAVIAGEEHQSVRFVPQRPRPEMPNDESWTPPPSLPVPGSDSAAYGYDGYGYVSPQQQSSAAVGRPGKPGSNPFMHAREDNPFRRESYSGFAPTVETVSGSGSGGSGSGSGGFSSEGYGSDAYIGHGHSNSVESERPVRRKDFAAPSGRVIGRVDEGDEDEETDVEGEEHEAVISRAAIVSNGTPKRPRLVDFTSERQSDEVHSINRLESHKAVAMMSPELGSDAFYFVQSNSITSGRTPFVDSAIIFDGSASNRP